ncbi:MAG: hypothetical protein BWY17_03091 [Deltaproteobacteria bacterium ADurb.Bin207]|nr:MAG: hypothetical protein BWY17_03091 [Deltaproteobacteria bacterium ADurb.Bin207]
MTNNCLLEAFDHGFEALLRPQGNSSNIKGKVIGDRKHAALLLVNKSLQKTLRAQLVRTNSPVALVIALLALDLWQHIAVVFQSHTNGYLDASASKLVADLAGSRSGMLVPLGQDQGIAVVYGRGLVGEGIREVLLLHGTFVDASPFVEGKVLNTCFPTCFYHPKPPLFRMGCTSGRLFAGKSFGKLRCRRFLWLWGFREFCSIIFQTSPCRPCPRSTPLRFTASIGPSCCAKRGISAPCCAVYFTAIFPSYKTAS